MCKFLTLLLAVATLAFGPYTALAQGQLPGGATAASFAVIRNGEQIGTSTAACSTAAARLPVAARNNDWPDAQSRAVSGAD